MAITLGAAFAAYIETILSAAPTQATTLSVIRFLSAGDVALCNITADSTDFNASGALIAAVSGTALAAANGSTPATKCQFIDVDQNVMFECTVGTSGADINFDTNVWSSGGVVTLSTFTFTQPLS